MIDQRELLERAVRRFEPDPGLTDRVYRRRDRKRRNQRTTAGVVGIAVFVAAIWVVATGMPFDQSQTEGVPGGKEPDRARLDRPRQPAPLMTGFEGGFGSSGVKSEGARGGRIFRIGSGPLCR